MAPIRVREAISGSKSRLSIVTRSQCTLPNISNVKRKADIPVAKMGTKKSRSAFGDLTNAKVLAEKVVATTTKLANTKLDEENVKGVKNVSHKNRSTGVSMNLKKYVKVVKQAPLIKSKETLKITKAKSISDDDSKSNLKVVLEKSSEIESKKSISSLDDTLYVTACEEIQDSSGGDVEDQKTCKVLSIPSLPEGVDDIDAEYGNDPFQVPIYAMDIFNYFKSIECNFVVENYMIKQKELNKNMRAVVVDWMVEVQESFELNHETLYLAVKLMDLYLSRYPGTKDSLQLIGAASVFVACKYDERLPPAIEDFLYICDGAYSQTQLMDMEIRILKAVDFNLGIPISYRFLRRYARCAKITMPTLTLARFILEFSLMDYNFIQERDSQLAAGALLLALKMKDAGEWTATLEHYSGYTLEDIRHITHKFNNMLHNKMGTSLLTIKTKYSHEMFFEVAKQPLLRSLDL